MRHKFFYTKYFAVAAIIFVCIPRHDFTKKLFVGKIRNVKSWPWVMSTPKRRSIFKYGINCWLFWHCHLWNFSGTNQTCGLAKHRFFGFIHQVVVIWVLFTFWLVSNNRSITSRQFYYRKEEQFYLFYFSNICLRQFSTSYQLFWTIIQFRNGVHCVV